MFFLVFYYQKFIGFSPENYRLISISAITIFSLILILEFGLNKSKWLLGTIYTFTAISTYLSSLTISEHISRNLNFSPEKLSNLINYVTFINLYDISLFLISIIFSMGALFSIFYYLTLYTTSKLGFLNLKPHLLKYRKSGLFKELSGIRLLCSAIIFFSSSLLFLEDSRKSFNVDGFSKKINSLFYSNEERCNNPEISDNKIYIYETNRIITLEINNNKSIYRETYCSK